MRLIFAALAGGLFGAGLLVSGMTDTQKVQGWLDVFGDWDPTLAFVMGGRNYSDGHRMVRHYPARSTGARRHLPLAPATGD